MAKDLTENHPRLKMLCYLYNRPTIGQAMGELLIEYIEATEHDSAPIEQFVATVRKEMKDHPKVGRGTT